MGKLDEPQCHKVKTCCRDIGQQYTRDEPAHNASCYTLQTPASVSSQAHVLLAPLKIYMCSYIEQKVLKTVQVSVITVSVMTKQSFIDQDSLSLRCPCCAMPTHASTIVPQHVFTLGH